MLHVLSAPVLYALELTPACPNRCRGCLNVFPDSPRGARPPLDFDGWAAVIDAVAPHAQRIKLTGGEPVLHPAFERIVALLAGRGLEFSVFTCGRWPRPAGTIAALAAAGGALAGLLVSLHGATAASHEAYSGVPGSFAETAANIGLAVDAGLHVTLSTVITTANLDELPAVAALASRLGAGHVVFNRYLGDPIPGLSPTPAQLRGAVQVVEALSARGAPVHFGNCIPQCFTANSSTGCLAGVAYCAVDPWGTVRPCTHSAVTAGNLLRQPLAEIWEGPAMQAFRDAIPPGCHRCPAFAACHGGCKALGAADPLADLSAEVALPAPQQAALSPDWKPRAAYRVRREPWGLVLMRGNRLFAVRPDAETLLPLLDGAHSLADIEAAGGAAALALVGALHLRGFISS